MAEKTVSQDSLAIESKKDFKGKKLRMAIIGCGGIAQTHMAALKKIPEVEVVAGCDIKPDRLEHFQQTWGVTELYEDWRKLLKDVELDAVSVCTPNGVHAPAAIDASKAGLHVITEKPMAMNPKECQQMIDAARKAGKQLAVGFQYRYHPNSQFLKKAADEGQFGNVMFVKCRALRRRGIPNWGVFGQKHLQGGGPMIDIGVHVIEMAHYVMGSPRPVTASGNTWTWQGNKKSDIASMWPNWDYKTYTIEDMAIGQIRFENGAIMQIEASFCNHIEKDVWNFDLVGEKGGCSWDPPMIFRDQAGYMTNITPGWISREADFTSMFTTKLQNFVNACLKGTPLTAPGEAGMAVQKILDGVYRAADAGKEVKID